MKNLKNLFFAGSLIVGCAVSFGHASAQNFTTLHAFSATTNSTNSDGANAFANLVLSGNILYGTTPAGGASGNGAVFKMNTDGTGFTTLHSFAGGTSEGSRPYAGLIISSNTLYGTTYGGGGGGGAGGAGTVFKVNTDGTGFVNLYGFTALNQRTFTNTDGAYPYAGLVLSGNTLYGAAYIGGNGSYGTIFKINTDGTGFSNIHNFSTLANGAYPEADLILSSNTLYGTTAGGGAGVGIVFSINTDGSDFVNVHIFTGTNGGSSPGSGLVLAGNTLYGTTPLGGGSNQGIVFAVNTDGTQFTNLYSFTNAINGVAPEASLVLSGNTLYGSTSGGGIASNGTIFAINTNGSGFATLYDFTPIYNNTNSDGAQPLRSLVLSSNMLYGTANAGGTSGNGTVFQLTVPPQTNGHPAFFTGEVALANSVYYLSFSTNIFGYYTYAYFPYLYHFDLGFEYFIDANDSSHGAYLYDFASGHFWYTSPTFPFPYLYDFTLNTVIYYFPNSTNSGHYTTNPRYFLNTATQKIFTQ